MDSNITGEILGKACSGGGRDWLRCSNTAGFRPVGAVPQRLVGGPCSTNGVQCHVYCITCWLVEVSCGAAGEGREWGRGIAKAMRGSRYRGLRCGGGGGGAVERGRAHCCR